MRGICLLGLAIGDGRIGDVVAGGGGAGSGARDSANSHIGVVLRANEGRISGAGVQGPLGYPQ